MRPSPGATGSIDVEMNPLDLLVYLFEPIGFPPYRPITMILAVAFWCYCLDRSSQEMQ